MEETPILRADALDDCLDEELDFAYGGIVATSDNFTDEVPLVLRSVNCGIWEPYENGQGGWSYRRVVVP